MTALTARDGTVEDLPYEYVPEEEDDSQEQEAETNRENPKDPKKSTQVKPKELFARTLVNSQGTMMTILKRRESGGPPALH